MVNILTSIHALGLENKQAIFAGLRLNYVNFSILKETFMIHLIFTTLYLFLFICSTFSDPQKVDLLISTYDTGDKNGLLPMTSKLKKKALGQKKGISYKILAFGVSKEQLKNHPALLDFILQKDVRYLKRTDSLSPEELSQLDQEVSPKLVIAGMSSKIQAQLLNHFRSKGVPTVAFYDNFDPFDSQSYTTEFFQEIGSVDAYMVPHQGLVEPLRAKLKAKNQQAEIIVSGQPAFEDWEKIFSKTDVSALKTKLKLDPKKKTILFVGGAYEGDYPKYLKVLFYGIRSAKDFQILITRHPKMSGKLERDLFEGLEHIQIIDPKIASMSQIATFADVLLTHKSSVGMQFLYMGIPVIFIAGPDYQNFAISAGLAPRIENGKALRGTIEEIMRKSTPQKIDMTAKINIPRNGSEIMADYIRKKIM